MADVVQGAVQANLNKMVKSFWDGRVRSGHNGLVLLDQIFDHVAEHRDWDSLALFVARSDADRSKVARLIKARFGDQLVFDTKKAKKHPTGVAFKMTWADGEKPNIPNHYGMVKQAIENKKAFNDGEMQRELGKAIGTPDKKLTEIEDYAKRAFKSLKKQADDREVDVMKLLNLLMDEAKEAVAKA